MVLTRDAYLREIDEGRIVITPFDLSAAGPGSYDLAIGNEFRYFKKAHQILDVSEGADYREHTILVTRLDDEPFIIMPGEAAHTITRERLKLPGDVCGWLQGRSTFARLGLMVHITASFVQPGVDNHQVLEMFNASPVPLALKPGSRICHIIFGRCEGSAVYSGKFQQQTL
ncbi:MAG: dCTP deaminase [Pseudomonadota bacterium]